MAGEGRTHYQWVPRTRELASWILFFWPVSVNTYRDHPTSWGLDATSIDVWGQGGRGEPIVRATGIAVADWIMSDESPCTVRWLIWDGWIWARGVGWREYWDASDMHHDHVHVTID